MPPAQLLKGDTRIKSGYGGIGEKPKLTPIALSPLPHGGEGTNWLWETCFPATCELLELGNLLVAPGVTGMRDLMKTAP